MGRWIIKLVASCQCQLANGGANILGCTNQSLTSILKCDLDRACIHAVSHCPRTCILVRAAPLRHTARQWTSTGRSCSARDWRPCFDINDRWIINLSASWGCQQAVGGASFLGSTNQSLGIIHIFPPDPAFASAATVSLGTRTFSLLPFAISAAIVIRCVLLSVSVLLGASLLPASILLGAIPLPARFFLWAIKLPATVSC
jgi:hypothetical protein